MRRRAVVSSAVTLVAGLLGFFPLASSANGASTADLSVTQVASNSLDQAIDGVTYKIYSGQVITYTVTVTNNGPDAAPATLTATAPSEIDAATLQSCTATCSVAANFAPYTSDTAIDLGTIAAGATNAKEVVFQGRIQSGTLPTDLTNSVSVAVPSDSTVVDSDLTNNTSAAVTPVKTLADLSLTQSAKSSAGKVVDGTHKVKAGETVTYTVSVTNAGPSAAQNVKVNDSLAGGMTALQSCSGACGSASSFHSYSSGALVSLGDLAAGATKTLSFRGQVPTTAAGGTVLTNVASVRSYRTTDLAATTDSDTSDRTSSLSLTVATAPKATSSSNPNRTNTPTTIPQSPQTGVYQGPIGPATYFNPQPRTKTVTYKKIIYTSAYGRSVPDGLSAPVVETVTQPSPVPVAPVATRIVRAPEQVWLLLPVGLLMIMWITYLILEPYEDRILFGTTKR